MMIRLGNFLFHYRNGLFPFAFLLLLWEGPTIFANDLLAAGIGVAVALAGQFVRAFTIGLAYIIRGGRNRQVYAETLVQEGMFAHCRNPLYLGNLLIILGVGLAANSRLFVLIGVPFFLLAYWAIIAAEENFLRQKFGQPFDDYCRKVNRLIPNLSGLRQTLQGMEFKWRRLVVKEYGSAFAWMAGATLLVIKNEWRHAGYQSERMIIWTLFELLLVLIVAFAIARYLKKRQIIRGD